MQNDVVIISGHEARHFFFNCESLTYLEGYFLLVSHVWRGNYIHADKNMSPAS